MLPPGVYSVTQIEQEQNPVSQVIQLVSLLEFLLNFVSPNQTGKDGKPATVGERVDANRALFANPPDVFFGIGVRNNIVHAKATDVTEAEIKRAISHLLNAVKGLRNHPNVPQSVRLAAFATPTEIVSAPTRAVTTSQLPPAPPKPNFSSAAVSSAPTSSTPLTPTAAVNPSYTTKVTPRQTMTPQQSEHKVPTNTIRNVAIFVTLLAAVLFLARPVWHLSKEKLYGSEEETRITRIQAETALKTIQKSYGNKPLFAAKVIEAQTAWRDAEIAFNQGKFKEAEPLYRRLLAVGDELALKDNERKDMQSFLDEMNKSREAARTAQAPQYATATWQEAENLKRAAETASKNGDLPTAKQTALQAQQKYDEAKIAADATPKPEPSPTPASVTPPSNPASGQASGNEERVRPRPDSE